MVDNAPYSQAAAAITSVSVGPASETGMRTTASTNSLLKLSGPAQHIGQERSIVGSNELISRCNRTCSTTFSETSLTPLPVAFCLPLFSGRFIWIQTSRTRWAYAPPCCSYTADTSSTLSTRLSFESLPVGVNPARAEINCVKCIRRMSLLTRFKTCKV
jgi:hypothetical protein